MTVISLSIPTITLMGFEAILVQNSSPAAPDAAQCYNSFIEYGIDPAVGLAIFAHESTYGKAGKAVSTRNWGNLRWGQFANKVEGGWAWYEGADAWARSCRDCARLLRRYADNAIPILLTCKHPNHIEMPYIFEHWAPTGDGQNNPYSYANTVIATVEQWRKKYPVEDVKPDPWEALQEWQDQIEARIDTLEKNMARQIGGIEEDLEEVEAVINKVKAGLEE